MFYVIRVLIKMFVYLLESMYRNSSVFLGYCTIDIAFYNNKYVFIFVI